MLPEKARYYLMHGLTATPTVIDRLMQDATPEDYDRRPDPERFTLREVLAHLADWEGVWMERMQRMRDEDRPFLPGYDEGQWAIDHNYAEADVAEQLTRYRQGRERMMAFLRDLSPEQWERPGQHGEVGAITIESLAVLVVGHDGYHTRQIVEWVKK